MIGRVLLDHSAWSRSTLPDFPAPRRDELRKANDMGRLVVCLPFLLEAGYSARNAADHPLLLSGLGALPRVEIDSVVEERALHLQAQLARAGHHRLPLMDLVIAALAERHGLGVLHYDADYDVLRERTDVRFESVWVAPRGTL